MKKKFISIILPIYNEEKNVPIIHKKITEILLKDLAIYDYEIIMVNDGSTDNSWNVILQLGIDSHVRGINFTRNFGHQIALTAGYEIATGDAIITMDSDLQHPPDLIIPMIKHWEQGTKIVYIKNCKRNDSFLKKTFSIFYYKILDAISDTSIPHNVADFRLIDKKVLDIVCASKEKSLYLRGIVAWTGFPYKIIPASFEKRVFGKAGYTWIKMFKLALDGFANFSIFPLKIASYVGLFVILTGSGMLFFITCEALIFKAHYPLFKWLVTIIYIFIGILFFLLWILGEYIGRIYEELKGRPLYIIKEELNLIPSKKREAYVYDGSTTNKSKTNIAGSSKNKRTFNTI